jgi:hypothetical protein
VYLPRVHNIVANFLSRHGRLARPKSGWP